jgi:hypothetical protein
MVLHTYSRVRPRWCATTLYVTLLVPPPSPNAFAPPPARRSRFRRKTRVMDTPDTLVLDIDLASLRRHLTSFLEAN